MMVYGAIFAAYFPTNTQARATLTQAENNRLLGSGHSCPTAAVGFGQNAVAGLFANLVIGQMGEPEEAVINLFVAFNEAGFEQGRHFRF